MKHADIQSHMADYLEGDLSLNKRAVFDAHLDSCPECAAEIAQMRATISALRGLPVPEHPPTLANDVMRRIRSGEGHATWSDQLTGWLERLLPPRVAVPVTAVATAVGVLLLTGQIDSPLPTAATTESLAVQTLGHDIQVTIKIDGVEPHTAIDPMAGFGGVSTLQNTAPWGPKAVAFRSGNDFNGMRSLSDGGVLSQLGLVANRRAGTPRYASPRTAHTVGWHRALAPAAVPSSLESGQDRSLVLLDDRLRRMKRAPARFARAQSRLSQAEQELWARKLSARARDLGELDEVCERLRGTADSNAVAFANVLEAHGD